MVPAVLSTQDIASLSSASVGLTESNAVLSTSGTLSLSDADATDATVVAQSASPGSYGQFNINTAGAWTYTTNDAVNQLNAGQVVTETFTVATSDGGSSTVTVTITGTEDIASLSSASVGLTESNAVLSTSGTLSLSDADATDATVVAQSASPGSYGQFNINTAGAWTYTTNDAVNQLNAGQVVTETFTVATSDGGSSTVTVTITGTNDAPVLDLDASASGTGFAAVFNLDNGNPITIGDLDLTLADPDSTIQSATITLGTGKQTGDILQVGSLPSGITATSYNATTGVLTLSGTASVADYQAALRSIFFDTTSTSTTARSITVSVTDSTGLASNTATSTVSILGAGNAPVIDLDANNSSGVSGTGYQGTYTLSGSGVRIADSDVSITDSDSANLSGATIVIASNRDGTNDVLTAGTLPSGITASYNASTGTMTLSGSATLAAYQAAINAITFSTSGTSTADRGITVTVTDGTNTSNSANSTIHINRAPTLDLDANNDHATGVNYATTYTDGSGAVSVADTDISIADADGTLTGATITLSNPKAGDVLSVIGTLPSGITATVSGNSIILSGSGTPADYQNAIKAIGFANSTGTPDTTARTIQITVTDGVATSAVATTTVTVVDVNSPPVIDLDANNSSGATGSGYTAYFSTTTKAAVAVGDLDVQITDSDSVNIVSATIKLTNPQSGDFLTAGALPPGITASYDSATATLTLSGSAFITDYQTAIRAISFDSTSNSTAQRTITVTVNDGVSASNVATTTIIPVVNNAPTANNVSTSGNEDALIPIVLTGSDTDVGGSVTHFMLNSLPANGVLYLDAAMTQVATTGVLLSASSNSLTLYFKPLPNWNSGASGTNAVTFNYLASDNLGATSSQATASITVLPVNDGLPVAAADTYSTTLSSAIKIYVADLLSNDTLTDNARLSAIGVPSGGTLSALQTDSNGAYYLYTAPASGTGAKTLAYTLTDDDGQTSTGNVTITVYGANDDLGTVQESGLVGGLGSATVQGSLVANDGGATGVSSVTLSSSNTGFTGDVNTVSNTTSGNYITVKSQIGTLVVNKTDGTYTYTLDHAANNGSAAGTEVVETFTYTNSSGGSATLRITVKDDVPQAGNQVSEIPEQTLPKCSLVFVVDVSGSMDETVQYVAENGTVTTMTRLAATKLAIVALINEYYSQVSSESLEIRLVTFDSASSYASDGVFASQAAALSAVNGLATGSGTNYEAGLKSAINALNYSYGTMPGSNVQRSVYFLSDGEPNDWDSTLGSTNPVAGAGYGAYLTLHPEIKSYAIGVGSGIANTSYLDAISNVDSLGDGSVDKATIVTDVSKLDNALLETVPAVFGGNVIAASGTQQISFGGDSGYISQMTIALDTDGIAGTPKVNVTFNYNVSTNQISWSGTVPGLTSPLTSTSLLTLKAANGFGYGNLTFNFATGDYTYYSAGKAAEGDSFRLDFIATDRDGDAAAGSQTINVVDGKPVANDDVDTLSALQTYLEGNVTSGQGTDAGTVLGSQLTSFTQQGSGVDELVDGAKVSGITFQGQIFNLTLNSTGSAIGGTYTISNGRLTWAHASNGSSLIFDVDGYYKYVPPTANTPVENPGTYTEVALTAAPASADMTITGWTSTRTATTVAYASRGISVGANAAGGISALESVDITFGSNHAKGVQNLQIQINNGGTGDAVTYTFYHIDGHELGQYTVAGNGWITMPTEFSSVGKITALTDYGASINIQGIRFEDVIDQTGTQANPADPQVIDYTLTDTDGDTSEASLTLGIISNHWNGTTGNDTYAGTGANDSITGGAGNDTLGGGAGHDKVIGAAGDDVLTGGAGKDVLSGGDGNDNLSGEADDDLLYGGAGNDTLAGGLGADRLEAGAGNDSLVGGDGADTLMGGAGNDTLTGGLLSDTFEWTLSDTGTRGNPAVDVVTDFNTAAAAAGGDVLDLRDLLYSENHDSGIGNLANYLHFEKVGADTKIHISSSGGFNNGYLSAAEDQTVVLQGVDLYAALGSGAGDAQIIQDLLNKGKLQTD